MHEKGGCLHPSRDPIHDLLCVDWKGDYGAMHMGCLNPIPKPQLQALLCSHACHHGITYLFSPWRLSLWAVWGIRLLGFRDMTLHESFSVLRSVVPEYDEVEYITFTGGRTWCIDLHTYVL